ncbi:hypothetical protein V8C42DRAFT_339055 [Trichoderma barbatum]
MVSMPAPVLAPAFGIGAGDAATTESHHSGHGRSDQHDGQQQLLERLRHELLHALCDKIPTSPAHEVVESCVSLFFQRSFPNLPIRHEPTLRALAKDLFDPTRSYAIPQLDCDSEGSNRKT